jgi:5-methylcytosine-specific restriction endonuclease McrA
MAFKKGHPGFKSFLGRRHSKETKLKMRLARLKNQPMHNAESVKKRSDTLIKNKTFVGEKNNRWVGGSRHYRGYGWEAAKKKRRLLDNYTCQKCGKKEEPGKRAFDVHHKKDFSKGGTNKMSNLLTVCRSCHNKLRNA